MKIHIKLATPANYQRSLILSNYSDIHLRSCLNAKASVGKLAVLRLDSGFLANLLPVSFFIEGGHSYREKSTTVG